MPFCFNFHNAVFSTCVLAYIPHVTARFVLEHSILGIEPDVYHPLYLFQTLVEVIKEYRETEHLSDMLTIVTRRVVDKQGQVPAPVNTLRYKLYL